MHWKSGGGSAKLPITASCMWKDLPIHLNTAHPSEEALGRKWDAEGWMLWKQTNKQINKKTNTWMNLFIFEVTWIYIRMWDLTTVVNRMREVCNDWCGYIKGYWNESAGGVIEVKSFMWDYTNKVIQRSKEAWKVFLKLKSSKPYWCLFDFVQMTNILCVTWTYWHKQFIMFQI